VISALAWLPAGACAAFALLRISGVEPGYPLFALLAFTPLAIGASLLAALWALLLRRRTAAAAAALVALALAIVVAPRVLGHSQPDVAGPELRLMSSNLEFGRADLEQLGELARAEDVDVISFEELTPEAARRLAASPLAAAMPYRIFDPDKGGVGTGLMSSHPLHRLSSPDIPAKAPVIAADVDLEDGEAEVWSMHPFPPVNKDSTDRLIAYLDAIPPPDPAGPARLLAGDYNATLDHPAFRRVLGRGYTDAAEALGDGLAGTWPANRTLPPLVTIDHVLGDTDRVSFADYSRHEIAGTDHLTVLVTATVAGG
jgi:endonuclease/exonuclease/phosphatase (EEP) superfamily protein YafD